MTDLLSLIGSGQSTCDIVWAYRYTGHVESVSIRRRNWLGRPLGSITVEIGERETAEELLLRSLKLAAALGAP